jgi:hypothetical protein
MVFIGLLPLPDSVGLYPVGQVALWDLQVCGVWGRLTKPQCGASCGMPNTHHKDHKDSQLRAGRFLRDS